MLGLPLTNLNCVVAGQVNAVKAARDEVTSVVEACIAETEAPDYEFPLLRPEPIEGPDGEMVPPPTRQMKALNSLKTNLDTLHELVVRTAVLLLYVCL